MHVDEPAMHTFMMLQQGQRGETPWQYTAWTRTVAMCAPLSRRQQRYGRADLEAVATAGSAHHVGVRHEELHPQRGVRQGPVLFG